MMNSERRNNLLELWTKWQEVVLLFIGKVDPITLDAVNGVIASALSQIGPSDILLEIAQKTDTHISKYLIGKTHTCPCGLPYQHRGICAPEPVCSRCNDTGDDPEDMQLSGPGACRLCYPVGDPDCR